MFYILRREEGCRVRGRYRFLEGTESLDSESTSPEKGGSEILGFGVEGETGRLGVRHRRGMSVMRPKRNKKAESRGHTKRDHFMAHTIDTRTDLE